MDKTFKLTDGVVAHIAKLVQIGLLEGTDIIDHFRRIALVADKDGQLYLSEDYEDSFNESLEKMQQFISEQSEKEKTGE